MPPHRLHGVLRVLEQRQSAAQRAYAEANEARSRIIDQISLHRQRIDTAATTASLPPRLRLAVETAHHRARARLESEVEQLEALLHRYDTEQLEPRRQALVDAHGQTTGLRRIIERRAATVERAAARKEQELLEEVALRRWRRARSG